MRGDSDAIHSIEDGAYRVDVVLQVAQDGWSTAEDADTVGGCYIEEWWHCGREDKRGSVDTLIHESI